MEKKTQSLRITLLLALALFGGLIVYTSQDRADSQGGYHADISYGLDLQVKWIADADQADFAVVQDTLQYYAGLLASNSGAGATRFRLDHCCDGTSASPTSEIASGMYAMQASLDFARPDMGQQLLTRLMDHGYLRPGKYAFSYGLARGDAALTLPIPSRGGEMLHIRQSAFELQMVPRVTVLSEEMEG